MKIKWSDPRWYTVTFTNSQLPLTTYIHTGGGGGGGGGEAY